MTWTAAKQACINMGGHLVTSTSLSENNFLFGLWPSGWIGLTDEVTEGVWQWVTGEPYSWSYWNGGEPNNSNNEDYTQFVSGGRWNDLPNMSLPYVLEFEYIVTYTTWTLHQTVYTNSSGFYSFSQPTSPAVEWYIQYETPTPITTLQIADMVEVSKLVLGVTPIRSIHYHRYDVNNDGRINVADENYINLRRYSFFGGWINLSPARLYTPAQYTTLTTNTTDLRVSIPGMPSMTINSPVSGGSQNYYLIAPGYKTTVNY
jgi:hypothetical protein